MKGLQLIVTDSNLWKYIPFILTKVTKKKNAKTEFFEKIFKYAIPGLKLANVRKYKVTPNT